MEKSYTILETANALNIKARTVREWIRRGKIKATKLEGSGRWVILSSEILRKKTELVNYEFEISHGYTVKQASELLNVREGTIKKWIKEGKIKATKIIISKPQIWIISEEEIQDYENKH